MTTASAKRELHDLLAGPLGRDNLTELIDHIYDSYTSVDLTDSRIKQMEAEAEGLSGDEKRDLVEKLGILHFARGNYQAAAEELAAVRTRKSASHFLGRTYFKMGREREALDCLDYGRSDEDDPATDVLMIEAHCNLREAEEAEVLLKKHKGDESPELLYARGRVAEVKGDYGEAMEHYEAALEKHPDYPESLFRLALNCDLNGNDHRAMELYQRCANLRPTFVGALLNLGILYEDRSMYYEAVACYKRILAIEPHHKQAQLYLKDAESSLSMYIDIVKARRLERMQEIFSLPVSSFELSSRSRHALERRDITTLGALTKTTREQLLNEKNFGDTSLEEIEELLARYDLEIGEAITTAGAPPATGGVEDAATQEKLNTPIETLELATRSRRCMERLGVTKVGELIQLSEEDLLAVANFGNTSLDEVKTKLAALGLTLKGESSRDD